MDLFGKWGREVPFTQKTALSPPKGYGVCTEHDHKDSILSQNNVFLLVQVLDPSPSMLIGKIQIKHITVNFSLVIPNSLLLLTLVTANYGFYF